METLAPQEIHARVQPVRVVRHWIATMTTHVPMMLATVRVVASILPLPLHVMTGIRARFRTRVRVEPAREVKET